MTIDEPSANEEETVGIVKNLAKAVAFCSALTLTGSSFAAQRPLEDVSLKVGLMSSPPFVIIGNTFQDLSGIDVDILRELQRRTGFKLENNRYYMTSFDKMIDLGAEGFLDICAGTISLSESRDKIFYQSVPILTSNIAIVSRVDSNVSSPADLRGKSIANIAGSTLAFELEPEIERTVTIDEFNSTFMSLYYVASGRTDVMFAEAPEAMCAINGWAKGKLKIANNIEGTESYMGYMFKKGSAHAAILNETLDQMREDGTVEKIIHKYLPNYKMPVELTPASVKLARQARANGQYVQASFTPPVKGTSPLHEESDTPVTVMTDLNLDASPVQPAAQSSTANQQNALNLDATPMT